MQIYMAMGQVLSLGGLSLDSGTILAAAEAEVQGIAPEGARQKAKGPAAAVKSRLGLGITRRGMTSTPSSSSLGHGTSPDPSFSTRLPPLPPPLSLIRRQAMAQNFNLDLKRPFGSGKSAMHPTMEVRYCSGAHERGLMASNLPTRSSLFDTAHWHIAIPGGQNLPLLADHSPIEELTGISWLHPPVPELQIPCTIAENASCFWTGAFHEAHIWYNTLIPMCRFKWWLRRKRNG